MQNTSANFANPYVNKIFTKRKYFYYNDKQEINCLVGIINLVKLNGER